MDKSLETYNLPGLNHEEIENPNTWITIKDIEVIIKNCPASTQKNPSTRCFISEIHKIFKEELISILLKLIKIEVEGTLPNSFYEASITLPKKPDKYTTRKRITGQIPDEYSCKTPQKILANWIQQHIKRIIHHDQVGFISGIQEWFNICKSINVIHNIKRKKDKNHMIISVEAEKTFDKIQHSFMIKTQQIRCRRTVPQHNGGHIWQAYG